MAEIHIIINEQGQVNLKTKLDPLTVLRILKALEMQILQPPPPKPNIVPAIAVPRLNGIPPQ